MCLTWKVSSQDCSCGSSGTRITIDDRIRELDRGDCKKGRESRAYIYGCEAGERRWVLKYLFVIEGRHCINLG